MASTHVLSVDQSIRQTVSWSRDNRIAVSMDKEIHIMKLDCSPCCSVSGFRLSPFKALNIDSLPEKIPLWTNIDQFVLKASYVTRAKFLAEWSYSTVSKDNQLPFSWGAMEWSPPGVAPDNRSVLAALTLDHRCHLFGQSSMNKEFAQLVDLSQELAKSRSEQFLATLEKITTPNEYLQVAYEQMSSIAVIELTWSEVFKGKFKDTYSAFVLLFLAMKNGDIVSCKINLLLKGIDDCFILPKQSPNPKVLIASLAWVTPLQQENSGVLAAGYADGCVYLLSVSHDPTLTDIHGLQMTCIAVQAITDFMPVSCLTWVTRNQLNPVLVYTKQQFIFAHSLDVTGISERNGEANGADKEQQTVGIRGCCTHAHLGNSLPATSLHCVGSTILMSAEDGTVRLLAVQGTSSDREIKLVKQLHFDLEEPEWECISAAVSPNGLISIALFSPSFMFDNLHERFRNPTYVHMCCIPTVDMETLETLLSSDTGRIDNSAYFSLETVDCPDDVLEFGRQCLLQMTVREDSIDAVIKRLMLPPYTTNSLGKITSRHLLTTLQSICKKLSFNTEVMNTVTSSLKSMTEQLLCSHIESSWQKLQQENKQNTLDRETCGALHKLLLWVQASDTRLQMLSPDVREGLVNAASQSPPDTFLLCAICGSKQEYVDVLSVRCSNRHTFGVCSKTLSVCDDVPYQHCNTCGALSICTSQLLEFPWQHDDPKRCNLCSSYMYSSDLVVSSLATATTTTASINLRRPSSITIKRRGP